MSPSTTTLEIYPAPQLHAALPGHEPRGERVVSIDVLRGLTVLLMIFVNDLAGVAGVPAWMKHIDPPGADGMTFVDVIFPAFLFIVGMSIPFALGRRLERGETRGALLRHILTRTLSLLLIGVFMVNTEVIAQEGPVSPALWSLLMYIGVILVWSAPPPGYLQERWKRIALRASGGVLLGTLFFLYRGTGVSGIIEMRPYWWGILGLIGWAYLVACMAYLLLRNQTTGLLGVTVLLYCLFIADGAGAFSGLTWITNWVDIGSALGSHAGIVVSGVLAGTMLLPGSACQSPQSRIRWAILFGFGLAAAGSLLHAARDVDPMFIINKIAATPPWCLWSSAITIWIWTAIYWLVDVRKQRKGTEMLRLSGQNALFAYILAPLLYAAFALPSTYFPVPDLYEMLGAGFSVGLVRSILFAFAVTGLAAVFQHRRMQLKL